MPLPGIIQEKNKTIFFLLSLQKIFILRILLTRSISVHFLTKIEQKSYGDNQLRYLNDQETVSRYSPNGPIYGL